jgi:hypothetical protein
LLDVEQCVDSGYNILREPQGGGLYTVAYRVDDAGRDLLVELGRSIGQMGDFPACSTCTGTEDGTLLQGFRAEVTGIVTSLGSGTDIDPPTLQVTSAVPSNGRSDFCAATQQVADPPTIAPSQQADAAATNAPTVASSLEETIGPTEMPSPRVATATPAVEATPSTIAPSQQADGAPTVASSLAETIGPSGTPSPRVATAAPAAVESTGAPTGVPSAQTNTTADAGDQPVMAPSPSLRLPAPSLPPPAPSLPAPSPPSSSAREARNVFSTAIYVVLIALAMTLP